MDGQGGVLSVTVAGANVHDAKLLAQTVADLIVGRPEPEESVQHLCLDKGYDNPSGRGAAQAAGYQPHIRRIGEEKLDRSTRRKTHPARRWVVERAGAWLNRCRAILVRQNKKASNYLGLIQLAAILLWYRRAIRLGPLVIMDEVMR